MTSNNFHRFLFLSLLLLQAGGMYGQTISSKDSLKSLLSKNLSKQQRVDVLSQLAYFNYDFNDSLGFEYSRQAVLECKTIEYPAGLQYAYTMLGIGHYSFGEYPQALEAFNKASQLNPQGTLEHSVYNLILTANILGDLGSFDSAEVKLVKAQELMSKANDQKSIGAVYKAYARMYLGLAMYDEALAYLLKSEEARKGVPEQRKLDLYTLFPHIYSALNQYEKAIELNDKLCRLAEGRDDNYHKAMCLMNRTELNFDQGNYEEALRQGFKTLELSKVYQYPLLRAKLYLLMGEIYFELSDYTLASDFLFRALAITEKSDLKPLSTEVYIIMAWLYKDQGNYLQALELTDKAQALSMEMKNKRLLARCMNIRGLILTLQKKYDLALSEHKKALVIRQEVKNQEGVAASMFNMALVYEELGQLDKALDLQLMAVDIETKITNQQSLAISYNGIAKLYLKLGRLEESKHYLEKTKELALLTKSQILLKNYYANYADLLDLQGNYKQASFYRKEQQRLTDSLNMVNNNVKLAEMQAVYQVEHKEKEIELLDKERALQLKRMEDQEIQIRNQTLIIVFGSIGFLLAVSFAFYIFRANRKINKAKHDLSELNEELLTQSEELRESNDSLKELNAELVEKQDQIITQQEELQKTNESLYRLNEEILERREEVQAQAEELREANETILTINRELESKIDERTSQLRQAYVELDTFFYRSSHDFRRPITTFMGLSEVAKITVQDVKALELFEKVNETAQSLDKMIRKLQSISDVGAQEMVYKEVLLRELIDNILMGFNAELLKKNIKVIEEIKPSKPFQSYAALVRVIIENLIENAIQFSSPIDPYIKIQAYTQDHTLVVSIADNGQGIDKEYHDRIYDMYFRANVASKGNGLGLYIVKKAVIKLQGTIHFSSILHEGSVFTVKLPLRS